MFDRYAFPFFREKASCARYGLLAFIFSLFIDIKLVKTEKTNTIQITYLREKLPLIAGDNKKGIVKLNKYPGNIDLINIARVILKNIAEIKIIHFKNAE